MKNKRNLFKILACAAVIFASPMTIASADNSSDDNSEGNFIQEYQIQDIKEMAIEQGKALETEKLDYLMYSATSFEELHQNLDKYSVMTIYTDLDGNIINPNAKGVQSRYRYDHYYSYNQPLEEEKVNTVAALSKILGFAGLFPKMTGFSIASILLDFIDLMEPDITSANFLVTSSYDTKTTVKILQVYFPDLGGYHDVVGSEQRVYDGFIDLNGYNGDVHYKQECKIGRLKIETGQYYDDMSDFEIITAPVYRLYDCKSGTTENFKRNLDACEFTY